MTVAIECDSVELDEWIDRLRAIEDPEQRWEEIRRAQYASQIRLAALKLELVRSMLPLSGISDIARVVGCAPSYISKIIRRGDGHP